MIYFLILMTKSTIMTTPQAAEVDATVNVLVCTSSPIEPWAKHIIPATKFRTPPIKINITSRR